MEKMTLAEFAKLNPTEQELARSIGVELVGHRNSDEVQARANARKSQYFTFELYPENPAHMDILTYIVDHEQVTKYVYVLHDRDVYDEDGKHKELNEAGDIVEVVHKAGDTKKPHYHVMIKRVTRTVDTTVAKFYQLDHVERVGDPEGMLLYFMHDTPASRGKAPYAFEELHGSRALLDLVAVENLNFVQFGE